MSRSSRSAVPGRAIEIGTLRTDHQFREAVALQKTIWGFEDIDLLPARFFVVASHIGGQVFGAYSDGRMVAFCLAIPGLKNGCETFLHSHMLGVTPEYRDRGLGRRLKLRQREDALARGIELIEWTFDPLELRNAWFNIERLGATVGRYARNQYGSHFGSANAGLPTDRCIAEWRVSSERVRAVIGGEPSVASPAVERIQVPADIARIRRSDPQRAREIQTHIADQFEKCFAQGLVVTGVERDAEWGTYLLNPWNE